MPDLDDIALLRQYAASNSESALAALVERHVNLVYSVALRGVGNASAAEEIAQAVFIILAKKARSLSKRTVLSGWLYQTARLTAANYLRTEIRRQKREQEAYMQTTLNEPAPEVWPQIAPLLDAALERLGEKDRNAVVLRFFKNKDLREVGAALGASEDAAKMRVNRALEKLRKFFIRRGVTLSAGAIAGAVSANSVHAAPVGLAKTISAVALAKGAAAGGTTLTLVKGALKIMAWTKAKTAVVAGAMVLLAAGTATVTVKEIQEHQNNGWQLGQLDSRYLGGPPYRTVILPTESAERSPQNGHGPDMGSNMADGRGYGIDASVEDMLRRVFHPKGYDELNPARVVLASELSTNRYDYFSNLPHGAQEALAEKIERKFGVVGRFETIETNVLFLQVKYPNAASLKRSVSETGPPSSIGNGLMRVFGENMNDLADFLEHYWGIPVINQTGLTNRFDFKLSWHDNNNGHPNLNEFKQALADQLGLELVPGTAPIQMLVVEKAN